MMLTLTLKVVLFFCFAVLALYSVSLLDIYTPASHCDGTSASLDLFGGEARSSVIASWRF